ncbi:S-layer homology domain-containing protein [Abyssisolibacter fermentans]|uniref:S-layer homology domain-containing protein n=1 Tax=Abyssisolibacter fermentans TaxID=1766203 RepID=UPI00082FF65C|nr:S-layer homology domain-containing protein [Abyssisolibacter fermentans]
MFKRALSILLVVIMIMSTMPITALANIGNTKGNTAEKNQQILDAISPITKDNTSKEDMLIKLQNLGLLDGEGELVTSTIIVDGNEMNLTQIREMLNASEADLTKIVSVDDISISLGDLKKMLAIEEELTRIRSEYLDPNITLTEAHEMALQSLMNQLMSEGLTFNIGDGTVVRDLSGVHRDVRVSLFAQITSSKVTVTAKLNKKQTEDVTFSYRTLEGSATKDYYTETTDTATIPAGSTETTINIPINNSSKKDWYNKINFYINCYDITNALFDNEKESSIISIGIAGEVDYPAIYGRVSSGNVWDFGSYYAEDEGSVVQTINKEGGNWYHRITQVESPAYYNGIYIKRNLIPNEEITFLKDKGIITHLTPYSAVGVEFVDFWKGNAISYKGTIPYLYYQGNNGETNVIGSIAEEKINSTGYISIDDVMRDDGNIYLTGLALKHLVDPVPVISLNSINYGSNNPYEMLCLVDYKKPTVTKVEYTSGNYAIGDSIPIAVTFSEPVKPDNLQIIANGVTLNTQESTNSYSEKLSFLYPVTQPISEINITRISGVRDLGNNTMNTYNQEVQIDIDDITAVNKRDAFKNYNIDIDGNEATIEIPIDTDNEAVSSWIISEAQENNNAGIISSLSAKVVGEDHGPYDVVFKIDDIANPTKLVGEFAIPYNFTDNDVKYIIAFYLDKEIGSSENKNLLYDVDTSYTIVPTVFLEDGDFSIDYQKWPEDLSKDLYIDEIGVLDLGIEVTNDKATWQSNDDFMWESSDENIATINSDGEIVFTGKNGQVYFTLIALNGGVGEQVQIKTETMSVKAGLTPFLIIPEGANTITVTKGDSGQLRWSSNIVQKKIDASETTETNFDINIYKAVYDIDDTVTKGELVFNDIVLSSESNQVASYNIPAEVIADISVIGKVSYIVEVSSELSSEIITAKGYIEVKASPAVVTLEPLENLFITDKVDSVDINYSVDNFDNVNTESEFLFKIIKNEDEPIIESTEMTGSYNLTIDDVGDNNLKDIYTVTVMAKNALEPTWSYDSYVLYVYNEDAIKIIVNGEAVSESIVLDNNAKIAALSSEEILKLKREISLDKNISINGDEYVWAELGDMISWDTSGKSATVNYNNLGTYFNIDSLGYTGYSPSTEFILSGLKNGDTRITATHGLSKMSDSLDVKVTTLKDKLYLFQAFPKTETELTYYVGSEKKTVTTNSKGAIAIYEENGINSDIYFKSSYNGNVYLGTVYNNNLKTKEQDATKNKLYPLNIAELRPVTKPSIALTTKDGSVYDGNVTLRGGVYKNRQYCESALINDHDGKVDQTVSVRDGVFEVNLDSTQFWVSNNKEELNGTDDIEFVFELQFPNGEYYPEVIKVDGNVNNNKYVQNGENKVILTSIEAGDGASSYLYKNNVCFEDGSELKINKDASKIGPNKNFPNIELVSTILCLDGKIGDSYTSEIVDQFKDVPTGQSYSMVDYPFSSYPILVHRLRLNKDTLWMGDRLSRSIFIKVNKDNKQIAKLPYHFNIVNLINIDITEDGEVTGFPNKMLSEIMKSGKDDFNTSDRIISKVLEGVGSVEGLDTSVIQMMLKPTSDPAVFDTIIKVNIGYGDVGGIDDREKTGTYLTGPSEDAGEFSLGVDSAIDTRDLLAGDYKEGFKGEGKTKKMTSLSPSFEGGGYVTGKIRYNFDDMKWEMFTTSTNIHAAAGINSQILINSMLGYVPVTAEFDANGSVSFSYSMASHSGTKIERLYDEKFVNDYLKELRFDLYVKAFGGIGVDYSIVALKVGVFGDQDLSYTLRWLNRDYLDKDKKLFGSELRAEGRVGIEFKAKLGFIDYTKILASAGYTAAKEYFSWDKIDDYWKKHKNGTIQNDPISVIASNTFNNRGMDMEVAYQTVTLEDRDYLEHYDREWKGPAKNSIAKGKALLVASLDKIGIMSIDETNEVDSLETNSYPYSNPKFTDDGELLVYLSDMDSSDVEKTKVCFSKRSGNSYEEGSELYEENLGYGDSYLNVAGDDNFAVATWVTQTESINKDAGTELTNEDIALMTNSTEIMASIYSNGKWSTPVALSDNKNVDLAPVVSTNGDKVLVAWRSAYAEDAQKAIEFGGNDKIVYKIYDKASKTWSRDAKVLYNGTLGNIMGIEAEMLDDGTSSVVYTVEKTVGAGDPNAKQNNNNLEVLYSVIDVDGELVQSVRATNDDYVDENPQITTHRFDDGIERFVIGWYSVNGASDIRLSAFNNEGAIYNGFIDSIKEVVSSSNVNISSKFKFSKGEPIDDISIVWVEPMKSDTSDGDNEALADKDGLYGVKILAKDKSFFATSPNQLAVMDDYTLIDHFDARTTDEGNIKTVILATDYNSGKEKRYSAESGSIYVKEGVSELLTATGVFNNCIRINSVYYDLESVRSGMEIPVQIEVYNSGIDEINTVDIELDGATKNFNLEYPLVSGSSKTFTVYYTVPENILNVDYKVTAKYKSESVSEDGKLYMVFPDVGISRIDIVGESEGLRDIAFSLYNDSGIKLDDNKHRILVKFYDNANLEGEPLNSVTITSSDDIEKINKGTYSSGVRFIIADLLEDGMEIPSGGITIYSYAKIEEETDDDEYVKLPEIKEANNKKSVTFESLIEKQNNQKVTILTKQSIDEGKTIVDVTVKNNSLAETTDGNLIVSIKNKAGEVIEQKQSYDVSKENSGLIKLGYEEKATQRFVFNSVAELSEVLYSDAVLDKDNADLGILTITGVPLYFERDVYTYDITIDKPKNTTIELAVANPKSTIKVNGTELEGSKADISIGYGLNVISIEVTSEDGQVVKTYTVNITIPYPDSNSSSKDKDYFKASDTLQMNIKNNSKISMKYFDQLKEESGRTLLLNGDFYSIFFDGKSEFKDVNTKEINFGLSLDSPNESHIKKLTGDSDIVNLYFAYHGELPTQGEVAVDIGNSYKNKELFLYYYNNNTNKLENYGLLKTNSKGEVKFTIDHCSDYILSEDLIFDSSIYEEDIDTLAYVNGYPNGNFGPNDYITRGQTATLLNNILADIKASDSKSFTDIDMWAKDSIMQLSSLGYINGYSDGTFKPNNNITRAEFVKIVINILDVDKVQSYREVTLKDIDKSWAKAEIEICYKLGLVNGYNNEFKPNDFITRAETVTIVNKLINREINVGGIVNPFKDLTNEHWAYNQIMSAIR